MNKLIYIVDDEPDILELISIHLKKNGFISKEFQKAAPLFSNLDKQLPDLIILDLMLPDMDGLEVCKQLKKDDKYSAIPIIMLTAKAEEMDKILGLELGADDYVTKPFSPKELVARIKAVLRRRETKPETKNIEIGKILKIDTQRYKVFVNDKPVDLTTTEFKILQVLATNQGMVLNREKILNYLWGNEKMVLDRTIDVHIKNLREKLGKAGDLIKNIRGIGYSLEA